MKRLAVLFLTLAIPAAAFSAGFQFQAPDDTAIRALLNPRSSPTQPADLAAKFQQEMDRYNRQLQTQYENARRSDALHAKAVEQCMVGCDTEMAKWTESLKAGKISMITYQWAGKAWHECKLKCLKS